MLYFTQGRYNTHTHAHTYEQVMCTLDSDDFLDPLSIILETFLGGKDILSLSQVSKTMHAKITGAYLAPRLSGKFVFAKPTDMIPGSVVSIFCLDVALCAARTWSLSVTRARVNSKNMLAAVTHLKNLVSVCFTDELPFETYDGSHSQMMDVLTRVAVLPRLVHLELPRCHTFNDEVVAVFGARVLRGERQNDLHVHVVAPSGAIPAMERMATLTTRSRGSVLDNINDLGTSLRDVHISGGHLDAADAASLAASRTVVNIDLSLCSIHGTVLRILAQTPHTAVPLRTIKIDKRCAHSMEDEIRAVRRAGVIVELVTRTALADLQLAAAERAIKEEEEEEGRKILNYQIANTTATITEGVYAGVFEAFFRR
jgi:hypothetical protein